MRKKVSITVSILVVAILLVACSSSDQDTLFVYNYGEYIDSDVIRMFEEEFNVQVRYDTFDSNETMYQRVSAGTTNYDVVFGSDYMIERMISEDMLIPLNFNKIPNIQYINDDFKNLDFDRENAYSVPYFWGTVGIVYDATVVEGPVDSWSILWDETYANRIYMYDSQRDSLMVALKLLGYSLNTHDAAELDEAKQLLIDQSPLVLAYVTDHVINSMISGNAALAVVYSGDAAFIMSENENMNYVIPNEGSNLWVDAMFIPTTSQNVDLAHEFINFITRPDISIMNTEYVMYSTPNTEALKTVKDEEWAQNIAYNPSNELLNSLNLEMFRDPGEFLLEYDRIWTEVLAGTR